MRDAEERPGAAVDPVELQAFVIQLGAAMDTIGEPVYAIESRLRAIAAAYGVAGARVSAFPTTLLVTMGRGEPATLEVTPHLAVAPRLDQVAALHRLLDTAERGAIAPVDGLALLDEIRSRATRFRPLANLAGYAVLSMGLALILHSALRDVAAAAVLGALVGLLRSTAGRRAGLDVLMPVAAAFGVSLLTALAVKHDLADPGLRAMIASLIVFVPGAALTTGVLELAAGATISGAARLVSGGVQLVLLAFAILAGVSVVGIPSTRVFSSSSVLLGDLAPWVGVLVFAVGVLVAYSAPVGAFAGLLIVLYAAWIGQVVGDHLFGGYISGLVGAAVMTPVATLVSRLPSGMPVYASFLPGFWLLVPGAMGLIGLAEVAAGGGEAGLHDLQTAVVSIFAVAVGVLCGTQLEALLGWLPRPASARASGS